MAHPGPAFSPWLLFVRLHLVFRWNGILLESRSSLSSRIYVTENGTLKGYITMAVLLTHQPDTPVAELLRELEEMLHEVSSLIGKNPYNQRYTIYFEVYYLATAVFRFLFVFSL